MKTATIVLLLLVTGCAPKSERTTTTETHGQSGGSGAADPAPSATDSMPAPSRPLANEADIRVTQPTPGEKVTSPLTVWGEAKGSWFFEARFPVKLLDAQGKVLATGPAQAKGEWQTPDFVPFEVTLRFTAPASGEGRVVLEKSNPSGLPANAGSIEIPVKF